MNSDRLKVAFAFSSLDSQNLAMIREADFTTIITGYRNLNSELITGAHQNNLSTWVEVGCFVGEDLWERYPNSRPIVDGKPITKLGPQGDKWYAGVIPTPEVVEDRLALIEQLLGEYREIEVLYLDFCRFPGRWEDGEGRAILGENTANNLDLRQSIITQFVREASKLCNMYNTLLGIFLTPYDSQQYGQDIEELSTLGNYLSPMLYHKICQRPSTWIGKQIKNFSLLARKPILPVIQSIPEPQPISTQEFRETLKETIQMGSLGVMVLGWEAMDTETKFLVKTDA